MNGLEIAAADLWATGITLEQHLVSFLRPQLDAIGAMPASSLGSLANRQSVTVGGIVTHRQRPATAQGVTFVNLEDETGLINIVCSQPVWSAHRPLAQGAPALVVHGTVECAEGVINIVAVRLERLDIASSSRSRDFR